MNEENSLYLYLSFSENIRRNSRKLSKLLEEGVDINTLSQCLDLSIQIGDITEQLELYIKTRLEEEGLVL